MSVAELGASDQTRLVGLARHVVAIDGELSDGELFDLLRLGVAIGSEAFAAALTATDPWFADAERALVEAAGVSLEARPVVLRELVRIAGGDGLHLDEQRFIERISALWP